MSADREISAKEAALIAQAPAEAEAPAPATDAAAAAERIAAVMAAARVETERRRQRHKMLYVWAPFAFIAVTGMSTLLWLWHKL